MGVCVRIYQYITILLLHVVVIACFSLDTDCDHWYIYMQLYINKTNTVSTQKAFQPVWVSF